MYDEFYNDSDEGMNIESLSEAEETELHEIEGIESAEEYAGVEYEDSFANNYETNVELRSTPENPLYDPKTGERIPYGYTYREWEKRKKAVARKKAGIKVRIERERKAYEAEEERLNQLKKEADYYSRQEEMAIEAEAEIANNLAGNGEDSFIDDAISRQSSLETLDSVIKEINPFEKERDVNGGLYETRNPVRNRESVHETGIVNSQEERTIVSENSNDETTSWRKSQENVEHGDFRNDGPYQKHGASSDEKNDSINHGDSYLKKSEEVLEKKKTQDSVFVSVSNGNGYSILHISDDGNDEGCLEEDKIIGDDTAITRKWFEQLNEFDSAKAYQMPDAFNDGKADTTEHVGAGLKSQLNDTVAAEAGSVVIIGATSFDNDTVGTYGKKYDDARQDTTGQINSEGKSSAQKLATVVMLDRQSSINDAVGSDVGLSGKVINHSGEEQIRVVRNAFQAKKKEQDNYTRSDVISDKRSTSDDNSGIEHVGKEKRKFSNDVEEVLRNTNESARASSGDASKEEKSFIQSSGHEGKEKVRTRNFQSARDGIEALGATTANNIRTADNSEENDVKNGIKIVRGKIDDIKLLLGVSGLVAASSLDSAMGARQAELMAKTVDRDIDIGKIAAFSDRKAQFKHYEKSLNTVDIGRGDVRKNAKKTYRAEKENLIKELQDQGISKYEARDLLKAGLGGKCVAENIATVQAAKMELLDAATKNRKLFTEEELKFLKSKDFFNTASSSRQIAAITSKYFDKSSNEYLQKLNPGASYLDAVRIRDGGRKLGPNIVGRQGLSGKIDSLINPHSYNLNINLTREKLHNRNNIRLDRVLKKDPHILSDGQKAVLELQKLTEKHSSYVERRKIFNRNKYSIKNAMRVSLHYFEKLESDSTRGLNQILSVKHGADAVYSLFKLGLKSTWTAAIPIRFIARKTGFTDKVTGTAKRAKESALAVVNAKKISITKKAKGTKTARKISKANETLKTSRPVVGVSSRLSSVKEIKQKTKKRVTDKKRRIQNRIMNNPVGRILVTPFQGIALVAKTFNRIKEFFTATGHWILLAVGVTVVVWLVLLYMAGLLMSFGKSIDISGHYIIMADQELIEGWINRYLTLDDDKFDEAVSHAEDDPINPYAWGGEKLYHYGVYEEANSTYFNRNYTNCYYHEKGQTKRYKAQNGFHIIYIDKNGNTIGSNTTNIKDVLSVSTTMIGNDWYSYQAEAEDLMDQLYTILNPEAAYVESEIYACTNGCDTYPRKHIDGDPANGKNWYSWSHRAYECNDANIYTEYNRLLNAGVKFYPDDTYTYSSKEYKETLVPQTEHGCNPIAKLNFERVKVEDGYYSRYVESGNGRSYPDYSSWVPSVYKYQLKDITYSNECGGLTYCYKYDYEGDYYRNTDTNPYTYTAIYDDNSEKISEANDAGFYGRYSRDYSSTIPHTAIKCCYGHKDLNIYITVLTKEDLIEANGGSIEYRVPVHFSHETGEVTEWEVKRTASIYSFTRISSSLQEITQDFYDRGGFQDNENQETINQIYGEDWFELYGVNIYSGAAIPDTLSRQTKVNRLNYSSLGDVSEIRKNLVETAYGQVGRIPYYWGGKATSKDIYANRFGTNTTPDYRGRTRKGLDCSGFVQLVFCIASGAELNEVGSTTSSFVPSLGLERISYSDLQPGDIGMENLPGASTNHVGIYAGEGMWIHCQGSPTNTVVYNNSNCFRYYYSLGR